MSEERKLFVAIDFPPEIVRALSIVQEQVKQQNLFEGTFVAPDKFHLTLQFLGHVPVARVPEIQLALQNISYPPFDVQLSDIGLFPDDNNPRVLWVGMHDEGEALAQLAAQVEQYMSPLGFDADKKFVLHITIARIKKVYDKQALVDAMSHVQVMPRSWVVDNLVLKDSTQTESGIHYTDVQRFTLV